MGAYLKTNNPDHLREYDLPNDTTLYDCFYESDGNPRNDNIYVADYSGSRGVSHTATSYTPQEEGYTTTAAGDNGGNTTYQVSVVSTDNNGNNTGAMQVTFNPENPDSLNKTIINIPGSGGWGECGVEGYNDGQYGNYALENNSDYTTINIDGCSSSQEIYDSTYRVSEQLQQEYGDPSAEHRYVITGASAGAKTTVDVATAIINGRGPDNHSPIDIMLLDGAGDCKEFVDNMNENPNTKQELINTGSVVYAYESTDPKIGGPDGPKNAINNLGPLAEEGMVIVEKDPEIGAYKAHSGGNSNEKMLSNGEADKVVNESFDPNNEVNKYRLILPDKDEHGDYKTEIITEKQLSAYSTFRKTIGTSEKVDYLGKLSGDDLDSGVVVIDPKTGEKSTVTTKMDQATMLEYNSIVDSANEIIGAINKTNFQDTTKSNYQFCPNSTTTFPESLNQANSVLFATSGNLINNITNDLMNIGRMLDSYATIDQDLTNEASALNGSLGGDGAGKEDTYIDPSKYIDTESLSKSIQGDPIQKGQAGKISASDISSMLQNGSLTGPLADSLYAEMDDARELKIAVDALLDNPKFESPDWALMKERLEKYSNSCEARVRAAEILEDAYIESLNLVANFLEPDEYLDDGEIGAYEEKKTNAEKLTAQLQAEVESLSQIKLVVESHYDPETKQYYETSNAGEYYAAQAKIAANEVQIEELAVNIAEYDRMLSKLNELASIMNRADEIMNNAIREVNGIYANDVNDMNPVHVSEYQS